MVDGGDEGGGGWVGERHSAQVRDWMDIIHDNRVCVRACDIKRRRMNF